MGFLKRLAQATVLALAATKVQASILPGCANAQWNSTRNFFSTMFVDEDFDSDVAEWPFVATYYNTYVRVMVPGQDRFIVLHCTNEVPPRDAVGENSLIVKIPVQNVAAMDGLTQKFVDMLGKSSTIRAVGDERAITSDCINTLIGQKLIYPQSSVIQPERVDVVFSSDRAAKIETDVLIMNDNMMSPLRTAGYIKLVSMFYGLEELAVEIYNDIAANYRCTAAKVNAAVKAGNWPQGRLISAVNMPKGANRFMVAQNEWWGVLATDAGVHLVDVRKESSGKGDSNQYAVLASDMGTKLAKESWAIIDTTQYLTDRYGADAIDFPRINKKSWIEMSGATKDSYAFKHDKVFLADKTVGLWNRHNFQDLAPARPDIMLRDLIEIIKPGFIPHSNTFLRPLSNPSSNSAAQFTSCTPRGGERASLMINSCLAPDSGTLFGAGLIQNAYNYVLEASEALMSSGTSGTSKAVIIGAAVGGAVGGAVLLALVAVVGLFMRRRRVLAKRNRADEEGVELPEMEKRESGESERSIANNAAAPGQNEGEADVPVPPVEVAVGPAQEGEVPRRSPNGRKMWWKR